MKKELELLCKCGKSSVLDTAINNGQPVNNHRIVLDTEASSLLATKQPPRQDSRR